MEKLKEIRKNQRLTQTEVAQKLNISQQTYSDYENKKTEPDIKTLIKLSELFHTSVDNLIRENADKINPGQYPAFQQELIDKIKQLNEIECAKMEAYLEGLMAGKKEYQEQKILNSYKGEK